MIEISVSTGDDMRQLTVYVSEMPKKIQDALGTALDKSIAHVRTKVLSSGRVPFRTGTLRRSITTTVSKSPGNMFAQIGSNLAYAPIHEYGGTFTRHSAWGKPTRPYTVRYKAREYIKVPFATAMNVVQQIFTDELTNAIKP